MIVKPSLAISNSIEFGKKWSSPPSMCKGVLDYTILGRVSTVFRDLQKELTGYRYMQMDEL